MPFAKTTIAFVALLLSASANRVGLDTREASVPAFANRGYQGGIARRSAFDEQDALLTERDAEFDAEFDFDFEARDLLAFEDEDFYLIARDFLAFDDEDSELAVRDPGLYLDFDSKLDLIARSPVTPIIRPEKEKPSTEHFNERTRRPSRPDPPVPHPYSPGNPVYHEVKPAGGSARRR